MSRRYDRKIDIIETERKLSKHFSELWKEKSASHGFPRLIFCLD